MSKAFRRSIPPAVPLNPFSPAAVHTAPIDIDAVIEAVVLDVIVNDSHPEYNPDGYNVGAIKYRAIKTQSYRNDTRLHWAFPLETNHSEYPMINEIVHIVPSLNRTYYTHKINTSNRVTTHPIIGLEVELQEPQTSADRTDLYKQSTNTPIRVGTPAPVNRIGSYFVEPEQVYRLRHDEGDVIFEGRSGHSIRFGTAWTDEPTSTFISSEMNQAPNLLMRVGPWKDAPRSTQTRYGVVKEDIDKDASSIWMVQDQIVDLTYSTEDISVHGASIDEFPAKLDKNQIIINTDRFVVNTKTDKLFGFSKKGIHWTSAVDFTVDAEQDYLSTLGRNAVLKIGGYYDSTAKTRHSFISPKVYVGMRDDESEPIPAGATLAQFLSDFIDAHLQNATNHVITAVGPGALTPPVIAALTKLKADVALGVYASFNSRVGYVKK